MYDQIINNLRVAYDRSAAKRDQTAKTAWKIEARQGFLQLLRVEGKQTLLEIGAGPGWDGRFFQDNGLAVTCTDLSPEMVRLCRAKGLDAHVMDFLSLDFPDQSFDAVYALNCLLHTPKSDLPRVFQIIRRILKPGGLFFMAVYGGWEHEGVWADDYHEPKRFFNFYTDEQIQAITAQFFALEAFTTYQHDAGPHSQLLTLRHETQVLNSVTG